MRFVIALFSPFPLLLLLLQAPLFAADDAETAWRDLPLITDGKVDENWVHLGYGRFSVDNGALRTDCVDAGMGLLLYKKEPFGDCQIRVVYRPEKPKSNAGVYVRIDEGVLQRLDNNAPAVERDKNGNLSDEMLARLKDASARELGAWYPVHHGYEVQICDAADDWHRTGAVYSLAKSAPLPQAPADGWRTMIITLKGTRIEVSVDGRPVSSFDSAAKDNPPQKNWYEPSRKAIRPTHGYIGLQNHDPGDVVWYKQVSIRPLSKSP
jgi:hypothetical protein